MEKVYSVSSRMATRSTRSGAAPHPEQESVAEHLIELDRREIQAELERLHAEESAA
jgi:hypothetical protein